MKQILQTIRGQASDKPQNGDVECNYKDNYYGDQVCVPRRQGGNKPQ